MFSSLSFRLSESVDWTTKIMSSWCLLIKTERKRISCKNKATFIWKIIYGCVRRRTCSFVCASVCVCVSILKNAKGEKRYQIVMDDLNFWFGFARSGLCINRTMYGLDYIRSEEIISLQRSFSQIISRLTCSRSRRHFPDSLRSSETGNHSSSV